MAETMPSWSPYNYVYDNPILFIDPDGRAPEWVPSVDDEGNITYTSEANDSYDTFVEQYGKEAADETFNQESVSYNDVKEYGEGEITIKGDVHPLIIKKSSVGFWGNIFTKEAKVLTDIQKIYNQIKFAEENEKNNGNSSFNIDKYIISEKWGVAPSMSVLGPLKTEHGDYERAGIIYSGIIGGHNQLKYNREGQPVGGFSHIYTNTNGENWSMIPLTIYFYNNK